MNFSEGIETLADGIEEALAYLNSANYAFVSPAKLMADVVNTLYADVNYDNNLFIGAMPDQPDFCFCFYDGGGGEQNDRVALDTSKVQVRGRGSYELCYKAMSQIKLALQSIPPLALLEYNLVGIWVTSSIASLGRDSKNRFMFSLNFRITIEPNDKANRH